MQLQYMGDISYRKSFARKLFLIKSIDNEQKSLIINYSIFNDNFCDAAAI